MKNKRYYNNYYGSRQHFKNHAIRKRISEHQKKTMEAMTKPVEINRAIRMMQRMGWKGGSLGLRGDGITDPIKPTMDHLFKEGLGLGKAPQNIIRIEPVNNEYFIPRRFSTWDQNHMGRTGQRRTLTMINTNFSTQLQNNFVTSTDFVSRYKIDRRDPDLRENFFDFSYNEYYSVNECESIEFQSEYISLYKIDRRPVKKFTIEERNALYKIDRRVHKKKRLNIDFRLEFLSTCLEFVTGEETRKDIEYNPQLLTKEMKFVETALSMLCSRKLMTLGFIEMGAFIGVLEVFRNSPGLMVECYFVGKLSVILMKYWNM